MKFFKIFFLAFIVAIGISPNAHGQIFKKKPKKVEKKAKDEKKNKMKPYDKVITKDAESQDGLFKVHKVDENWFFELPADLLEKEILVTNSNLLFFKVLNNYFVKDFFCCDTLHVRCVAFSSVIVGALLRIFRPYPFRPASVMFCIFYEVVYTADKIY